MKFFECDKCGKRMREGEASVLTLDHFHQGNLKKRLIADYCFKCATAIKSSFHERLPVAGP